MHARNTLTIGNFFLSVSSTLVSYTLLSYLSTLIPSSAFGIAISLGGVIAVVGFFFLPVLVARYGSQPLALTFAAAEMVLLFAVGLFPGALASALFVVLVLAIQPLLYYELDLLLEATVDQEDITGRTRTFFLNGANVGVLVAPLLIGILLADSNAYATIFFAAAAALLPFVTLFAATQLPEGTPPAASHVRDTLVRLARDRDLASVTVGHLILYLFYIWAPLYAPIYLHAELGIPWSTLGWVFSVMLIPYLALEYPAGWIADRILGDKEMMFAGFVIAGGALAAIGLLTQSTPIAVVIFVLVSTRVGAALIESMTEGHFFRRVSEKDVISVSVFRGVWPLASAIAPLVGGALLSLGGYRLFFGATGIFVLVTGVISTLLVRDFR